MVDKQKLETNYYDGMYETVTFQLLRPLDISELAERGLIQ